MVKACVYQLSRLGLAVLVMTGCATMSKDECRTATRDTWLSVGYDDGRHGRPETTIRKHQQACAGIASPDLSAYQQGYTRGVAEYCVDATGYTVGLRGRSENGVCASAEFRDYHEAHRYALQIYRSEMQIAKLTADLQKAYQARADAEYDIKLVEAELVSPGLSTRKREELLAKSRVMRVDLRDYDRPIHDIGQVLQLAIETHNRDFSNNPYERRPLLVMPTIEIAERPDPRPRRHDAREHDAREHDERREHSEHHDNHPQNARRHSIVPESFVIQGMIDGHLRMSPEQLLAGQGSSPINEREKRNSLKRDKRSQADSFYLYRFPNQGIKQIQWSGRVEGSDHVLISYWTGQRYVSSNIKLARNSGSSNLNVNIPSNLSYLYVLVGSPHAKVITSNIIAVPNPATAERRARPL